MSTVGAQRNTECTAATQLLLTSEDIKLVQEAKETFSWVFFFFFTVSFNLFLGVGVAMICVTTGCRRVSEPACV